MIISTLLTKINSPDVGFPYSANLFLNQCTWRDKNNGLVGRVTTGFALIGVALIALIEATVITPIFLIFFIFSKDHDISGLKNFGIFVLTSICGYLYALTLNLFVQNITGYLIDLDVRLNPSLKEESLSIACLANNYPVAEVLLKKDWVDPHRINKNGVTDALLSRIFGSPNLNPLFQLNDYEKAFLEFKNISHWLGLKGEVELYGHTVDLEGSTRNWMFDSLATAVNKFKKTGLFTHFKLGAEKADILEEALNSAYTEHSPTNISQRVQDKKLSFLEAGWKKHGIGLAFYGNYLAIGDRGVRSNEHSTLEVFKIDPTLVTPKIVEEIDSITLTLDLKEGQEYFFKTLPAKLSPTGKIEKDSLCRAFASIAPGYQKGGHCGLAGKKSALRFAWAMLLSDEPDEASLQQARWETKLFTDVSAICITNTSFQTYPKKSECEHPPHLLCYPVAQRKFDRKFERVQWNRWKAGYGKATWRNWPKYLFRKYVTAT